MRLVVLTSLILSSPPINIRGRKSDLDGFVDNNSNNNNNNKNKLFHVGLHSGIYRLISLKLGVMIDTTKLSSLKPV